MNEEFLSLVITKLPNQDTFHTIAQSQWHLELVVEPASEITESHYASNIKTYINLGFISLLAMVIIHGLTFACRNYGEVKTSDHKI